MAQSLLAVGQDVRQVVAGRKSNAAPSADDDGVGCGVDAGRIAACDDADVG